MKSVFAATIIALSSLAAPQEPVSKYAEELRLQNERTQAVSSELLEMIRQGEKDQETIASVGRRFLDAYDGAIQVMNRYRAATTRFGLQSEVDDLMQLHLALQSGEKALHTLVEGTPPPPFSGRDVSLARQMFQEDIVPMIKEFVDQQLEVQGAADFLTDPGFEQAALVVAAHIGGEIRGAVDREIEKIVGARIRIGMSLKEHLMMMARSWVSKSIGSVILRFAANHFIVERLGLKILEWIGPRLREFLRPKGNLEARVDRAIAGLRDRRGDLNRMDSAEDMQDVRRMVEAAENHIRANEYLRKDLNNAKQDALYNRLADEEVKVIEAIKLAKTRFLMNSKFAEVFGELTSEWRSGRKRAGDILEKLGEKPAAATGAYEAEARQEWKERYPGKFGLSISKRGAGFHVKATDPKGRVVVNHLFTPDSSAPTTMFECKDAAWSDGAPLRVVLYAAAMDVDGTPKSGWMTWWTQQGSAGRLAIDYRKSSASPAIIFKGVFRSSADKNRTDVKAPFRVELTPRGTSYRLRVIDGTGRVIANADLRMIEEHKSNAGQLRSRVWEAVGGAWIDGTPLRRILMTADQFEDDVRPWHGILSWFAQDRKIVLQLEYMKG